MRRKRLSRRVLARTRGTSSSQIVAPTSLSLTRLPPSEERASNARISRESLCSLTRYVLRTTGSDGFYIACARRKKNGKSNFSPWRLRARAHYEVAAPLFLRSPPPPPPQPGRKQLISCIPRQVFPSRSIDTSLPDR
jgi:hypothetical protein